MTLIQLLHQYVSKMKTFQTVIVLIFKACKTVLNYLSTAIKDIKTNLDGNNVTAVLQELGIRFHRVIYDHMLQFQYNTAGKIHHFEVMT